MRARATRPLALLTLPLLLFACGQRPTSGEADPYAGADHPWSSTPPGGQVAPLTLTPGWNTLQYETPIFLTNGWGPVEKNRSNGEQAAGDGKPLTLNGRVYSQGFGVHALSQLTFDLQGTYRAQCTRFTADIGVDDEVGSRGSVIFQVYLDGVKAYDSGVMTGASATKKIDLDISGKRQLWLWVTDAGNGVSYDHADWADPRVLCGAAPSGTHGSLDPSFKRIQTDARPLAAAVQTDGKILTFGAGITPDLSPDPSTPDFFVVRSNRDGGRDTTFGQNGVQTITAGAGNTVRKIAVQADGKIVAAGTSTFPSRPTPSTYVTLLRLLPNGQPDPSFRRPIPNFDRPGVVFTNQVQNVQDFVLQADGKIVVVEGVRGENTFTVTRFDVNGNLDPSFGPGGRVTVPFALPPDALSATVATTAVGVQPDGKIVAGGTQYVELNGGSTSQQVFARLLADGSLDPSFGSNGRALGRSERFQTQTVNDLAVQPDGKILSATVGYVDRCTLDRLNANGSTDTTFPAATVVGFKLSSVPPMQVALQSDGKILTAGCNSSNSVGEITQRLLTRTLPNGQPDPSFGGPAGSVVVEDNRSVLLQPDGKIVVGLNPIVRLFP